MITLLSIYLFSVYLMMMQADTCNLNGNIKFTVDQKDQHYELYAQNLKPFDITFEVNISTENLTTTDSLPIIKTVPGNKKIKVTELFPVDKDGPVRYEFKYNIVIGNMYAEHDTNYIYNLPYKPGASHKVGQSFGDDFTHNLELRYAVDFEMKEGTPIYVIREGIVVAICDVYDRGGLFPQLMTKANYVFIRHLDNTIATYAHLRKDGAAVKVGQYVEPGTIIGYSGNTGFSSGPHLHLEVFKAIDGKNKLSLRMKFRTAKGIFYKLKKGKKYKAAKLQLFN